MQQHSLGRRPNYDDMVETRRSSSSSKRALPSSQASPPPSNKRSKATDAPPSAGDMPVAPPSEAASKSGSESREPELQSSDPDLTDDAKPADVDKSVDADVEADALVSPPTPGETAVDTEKSKAVGVVFNGRVKKRVTKLGKVGSRIPWARLISQCSQSADQEALKTLVAKRQTSLEQAFDGSEGNSKGLVVQKADEDEVEVELESTNSKKRKLSASGEEANLEIAFSVSDIKGKYKNAMLLPNWKAFQTVIFLEQAEGLHDSKKIAAFDFDGCLVKTNVKRVGADAWSLMYPSVPDKLQSLYNDGYKLVIFTNEANIERWKNKRQIAVDTKLGRLNNFIKCVKVPIQVFVACGMASGKAEDPFRKPKPGMWQIMEKYLNSGISIDMDQSFYVGDAAGRKNDHSDADIQFAKAVGLKFYLPEEYFGS